MAVRAEMTETTPRRITILGSTGSIGTSTLDIIERDDAAYDVVALTANSNVDRLIEQAHRLTPDVAVIGDDSHYAALKDGLSGTGIEVAAGAEALVEAGDRPADFVMGGIVGYAGLAPTLAAVKRGACVGLANKECLVCAGDLMMAEVRKAGGHLLPVDSEHSAIFQVFDFDQADRVSRIILTASGGPFLDRERQSLADVTPAQAVAHPNWTMGAKISVDSATMMNKGLEVIEAHHLFPVATNQIEIVVHPQSVIHSMVEYIDGSVLAQLGTPDMRTPIAYALGWPNRIGAPAERLDFSTMGDLTFRPPDDVQFPALRLAREALEAGGSAPTILNAANEEAVYSFLAGGIGFLAITDVVAATLDAVPVQPIGALEDVIEVDASARDSARNAIGRLARKS